MTKLTVIPGKFLLLLSSSLLLLTSLPYLVISESTSETLLKIKQQWGNQAAMQSWNPKSPYCEWHGINCTDGESVTGIRLKSENIKGEIPSSICDLKNLTSLDLTDNYIPGNFPTLLYNCTKLQSLVLSSNLFVGKLPNDINKLSPYLQYIDLSANNFTGDIPSSLAQLKGLISLHLDSNLFDGTFPSQLGYMENLEELVLAYNPFSPANLPKQFGMLKSLKYLRMSHCNLIGQIPTEFSNLTSLEHLDLVENQLVAEIPTGLFLLTNLQYFYVYKNSLSGGIPASIQALNMLEFDVSQNNLSGIIPQQIANLTKLEILNLFQNHFHGTIPPNIARLPSLKQFKIYGNRFSGTIPSEFGLHSSLEHFEVPDNAFTGPLPENLCSGGKLVGLVAFNNYLNGTIPTSLSKCNSLLAVILYNNSFSGEVPQGLWTLQYIQNMQLSSNQFSGQLPDKFASNLSRVEISNNRFSGKIPSVTSWKNLEVFKATNNLITGPIPLELTNLSRLITLSLHGNQLTGELPSEIMSWQSLNSLDLSANELSGSIPSAIASLPVLNYLDLSDNQLSGQIPPEFGQLRAPSLNFSSNKLTGEIPAGFDNSAYSTSFLNTHLCSDNGVLDLPKCSINQRNLHLSTKYLALIIVLAFVAFLVTSYFIAFIISEIRRRNNKDMSWKLTPFHRLNFTEEKILANLSDSNMIGFGGFGKVYRIIINNQSGDAVAVKKIWNNKKMSINSEKEFIAEFQILGTIRHLNIVKLLCCLSCEDSKLLVYEYMENQSLDKWIHENKTPPISSMNGSVRNRFLDWPARLKIAMDSAQGLCYMHHDCSPPIIHRDVKSSNILLDSKFNAKIADFGLAKILAKPGGGPHTVSAVAGSFGYMAPEYCYTTKVNEKIDIYSFGVVLLELVTSKEPHIGDEHTNLAEWAWRHYSEGHPIADVLDKQVVEPDYLEEMTYVFKLGLMCTSTLASSRPSMKEVVQLLRRCNSLGGSGLNKSENDRDVSPLLGGKSYISSCKNSKRNTDDELDMV